MDNDDDWESPFFTYTSGGTEFETNELESDDIEFLKQSKDNKSYDDNPFTKAASAAAIRAARKEVEGCSIGVLATRREINEFSPKTVDFLSKNVSQDSAVNMKTLKDEVSDILDTSNKLTTLETLSKSRSSVPKFYNLGTRSKARTQEQSGIQLNGEEFQTTTNFEEDKENNSESSLSSFETTFPTSLRPTVEITKRPGLNADYIGEVKDINSQLASSLWSFTTTIPSSSISILPSTPSQFDDDDEVKHIGCADVVSFSDIIEPLDSFRAKLHREAELYNNMLGSARGTGLERCKKRRKF